MCQIKKVHHRSREKRYVKNVTPKLLGALSTRAIYSSHCISSVEYQTLVVVEIIFGRGNSHKYNSSYDQVIINVELPLSWRFAIAVQIVCRITFFGFSVCEFCVASLSPSIDATLTMMKRGYTRRTPSKSLPGRDQMLAAT